MDADAAAGKRWGLVGCSHFSIGHEIGSLVAVLPSDYEDFVISAPLRAQTGTYAEFARDSISASPVGSHTCDFWQVTIASRLSAALIALCA